MPSRSTNTQACGARLAYPLAIAVAAVLILALETMQGGTTIVEPFHSGEFFAAATSFLSPTPPPFLPITIHGALDFIPTLIGERLWGADHDLLPTLGLHKLINFFSAAIFVAIAYRLSRGKPFQTLAVLTIAVIAPALVGQRDLLLLASLLVFLIIADRRSAPARHSGDPLLIPLLILLGIVLALGVHWSYDRGIAGMVSVGAGVLAMAWQRRVHAVALLSFVLCLVALALAFDTASLTHYSRTLAFLMQTSGQWRYPWNVTTSLLTAFAVVFNIVALSLLVAGQVRSRTLVDHAPKVIVLVLLALVMLKIGTNRADSIHIPWTLWAPLLGVLAIDDQAIDVSPVASAAILLSLIGLAALGNALGSINYVLATGVLGYVTLVPSGRRFFRYLGSLMLFGALALFGLGRLAGSNLDSLYANYTWIRAFADPPPNASVVTEGVRWAAERITGQRAGCVFDLSNSGLINAVTRLPPCSRFTYPVYAGRAQESTLLDDLRSSLPAVLVFSTTHWSYSIDGKNMRERFPDLDQFIVKHYPREACASGYCVRYLSE